MSRTRPSDKSSPDVIRKSPTGIKGLDEITGGGLPEGRPTLICGNAGCGKTVLAMEFLVRGATTHNQPGLLVSFEETAEELAENVASLGFDLRGLIRRHRLHIDSELERIDRPQDRG
jgi:circadian clock protein KaiC